MHRAKDRSSHRASLLPIGVTTPTCTSHAGCALQLACTERGCDNAAMCLRCLKQGPHVGHSFIDMGEVRAEMQVSLGYVGVNAATAARDVAKRRLAHLTARRAQMGEEDHAMQASVDTSFLSLHEAVLRRGAELSEDTTRSAMLRACHIEAEMLTLTQYIATADSAISKATATCALPEEQTLRAVLEGQEVASILSHLTLPRPRRYANNLITTPGPEFTALLKKCRLLSKTDFVSEELAQGGVLLTQRQAWQPATSEEYCTLGAALPQGGVTRLADGPEIGKTQLFTRAIALDPHNSQAYSRLARDLPNIGSATLEDGNVLTKEDLFKRAIALDGKDAVAHRLLGTTLPKGGSTVMEDGSLATEELLFKRAIALDPTASRSYEGLGVALREGASTVLDNGDEVTEETLFRHAVHLDPLNVNALYNLGAVMKEGGKVAFEKNIVLTKTQLMMFSH